MGRSLFDRIIPGELLDELPDPDWLIEGLLPRVEGGCVGIIWGVRNQGKTFFTLDAGCRVENGLRWLGRAVQPGRVLYLAVEGGSGMGIRRRAWEALQPPGVRRPNFLLRRVHLGKRSEVTAFLDEVKAEMPELPRLVIIDTLHKCIPGLRDGDESDMGVVMEHLDMIKLALNATVLVVQHPTKSGGEMRGSGSLGDDADFVWEFRRDKKTNVMSLHCEKMKHAEVPEQPIRFTTIKVKVSGGSSLVVQPLAEAHRWNEVHRGKETHGGKETETPAAGPVGALTPSAIQQLGALQVVWSEAARRPIGAEIHAAGLTKNQWKERRPQFRDGGWIAQNAAQQWHLTDAGLALLADSPA